MKDKLSALIQEAKIPMMNGKQLVGIYALDEIGANALADHLIANGVMVLQPARPLEEWDEDHGDVLWWRFPIEEPPYVGSPLDAAWPGYHTHWTPIPIPTEVNNAEMQ